MIFDGVYSAQSIFSDMDLSDYVCLICGGALLLGGAGLIVYIKIRAPHIKRKLEERIAKAAAHSIDDLFAEGPFFAEKEDIESGSPAQKMDVYDVPEDKYREHLDDD